MQATQNNQIIPCLYCGHQFCGQWAKKPSMLTDKIINPALLEFMVAFFDFQDVKALGEVNHSWNKRVCVNKKKFRLIDGDASILLNCRVQNLICHSRDNPITSHKLREFGKLQRLFNVTIHFHSSVLHFKVDYREDYPRLELLQFSLGEILHNIGKPRESGTRLNPQYVVDHTGTITSGFTGARYACLLPPAYAGG